MKDHDISSKNYNKFYNYYWEFRKRLVIKEFFSAHYNRTVSFGSLIFHSWELLFPLNICAFFISGNSWIIGITIRFYTTRCFRPNL